VDVAISDCIINLSTDKGRAIGEAYRVLKPGERFAVSDMVFLGDKSKLPAELVRSVESWAGCVSGALERVMNLGENRIGMRIPRSAWFLRDLRFPHS
jgi:arsenite methyltransferase